LGRLGDSVAQSPGEAPGGVKTAASIDQFYSRADEASASAGVDASGSAAFGEPARPSGLTAVEPSRVTGEHGLPEPKSALPASRRPSWLARLLALFRRDPVSKLVRANEPFLDEIQRRAFLFFWENTGPRTGLVKDRASNFESPDAHRVASIAATGFGLTALGVAESRGWITRAQAYERARTTLLFLRDAAPQSHGWFPHFLDIETGKPMPGSEISSIDTALLLSGALFVGRHFKGTEVETLARDVYERVDFPWMMTDGGAKPEERTLSMGVTPEGNFIKSRWSEYSEHLILLLLGLGSPTHPLPAEVWDAFRRPTGSYGGHESLASGPLFTHQYTHLSVDFRGRRDRYADYFESSVQATLANRQFAVDQSAQFTTYGPDSWGLTASDGPEGYRAYGAPPGRVEHDGTVAPTAAGGSIAFTPELSIRALRFMKDAYGEKLWGRYGFADAFNTDPRWKKLFNADGLWRSPDVIGIDQGAVLLMIENLRSGQVWKTVMSSPYIKEGLARAGFSNTKPRPKG
jgi:hypothetical protein